MARVFKVEGVIEEMTPIKRTHKGAYQCRQVVLKSEEDRILFFIYRSGFKDKAKGSFLLFKGVHQEDTVEISFKFVITVWQGKYQQHLEPVEVKMINKSDYEKRLRRTLNTPPEITKLNL